jgi:hypothetical protein
VIHAFLQPIVPVKMQDKWAPAEWLGVVTAGLLWTPMYEQSTRQQNLTGLVEQIKAAVPTTVALDTRAPGSAASSASAVQPSTESTEVLALRTELDSLRQDLQLQMAKAVTDQRLAAGGAEETLAPIPAEVPTLSLGCRPTEDMERLKVLLISATSDDNKMAVTSEKQKIGALGMGGIGKTVTATYALCTLMRERMWVSFRCCSCANDFAVRLGTIVRRWLARHEEVRRHFELVVWVRARF